jgi:hypothetical protein
MMQGLRSVAEVFAPSDSDWVVTIVHRNGAVRNRRISPGTVTEEQAVAFALAAERVGMAQIDFARARRASDRSLDLSPADAFLARMRRMRT